MNAGIIDQLASDDPVRAMLGAGAWQRTYGRVSSKSATLVYERRGEPQSAVVARISGDLDTIVFSRWDEDDALPALPQLVRRGFVPVRYRPGKRCTLNKGNLFAKCVADDRGLAINRDAQLLWNGDRHGMFGFGVARPAGWLPSLRLIFQHRVAGRPVIDRLAASEGADLARRLGAANATLIASPLLPDFRFSYADQLARTAKYAHRLQKQFPATAPLLDDILAWFASVAPGAADRPIHGAPHAHQWLDGAEGLKLVDFDRFGLGDPELDAATFLAEADFEDSANAHEIGAAYVEGFRANWPLNDALVHAYRLHKHVAKACRMAVAIRSDAEARALQILNDARALTRRKP